MKFGPVPVQDCAGKILAHNIFNQQGRRAFRKGRVLAAEDVLALQELGRRYIYAAELEPGDVEENEAACRIAKAVAGQGLSLSTAVNGRVNFQALDLGVLYVNAAGLSHLNRLEGISLASAPAYRVIAAGKMAANVKVIPFAIAETTIAAAEALTVEYGPLLSHIAIPTQKAALVYAGEPEVETMLRSSFEPPLRERLERLGASLVWQEFAPLTAQDDVARLASAIIRQAENGAQLVIVVSETSIMDGNDLTPSALRTAGGQVAVFGAPVDPGNLLLIGYLGDIPVVGAPGCARSRKENVVDWVLPRLLAGERLTAAAIAELGAGGMIA